MRSFCECVAGRGVAHAGQAGKKHIRPLVPADSTQTAVVPNQSETDSGPRDGLLSVRRVHIAVIQVASVSGG